jgi:nucleoside-diphosphate-sugar epimerase
MRYFLKRFATGGAPRLSYYPETVPGYVCGDIDVHFGAALRLRHKQQGRYGMRVFITGATGFIGTELVKELIEAGHTVRGLTRSDAGAAQLEAVGAEVHRGTLEDLESLRSGATGMDAVVNLAFNHDDMSKFAQSAEVERHAVEAMASVLDAGKLLVVTSGTGLAEGGPGHVRTEKDAPTQHPGIPRNPELVAGTAAERGVRVAIVRLPQVHDTRKQGLVPFLTQMAREKGISAYVGKGENRWAAAPLKDVSLLYRLVLEKTGPGVTVYHAVQEEGVPLREIAETLGRGLKIPVVSLEEEKAAAHFGWLTHFAALDMPASSDWTRKTLNWEPTGPGLIEDLTNMKYF